MTVELPPTFTATAARARGVHPRTLAEWQAQALIVELVPGVYRRADAPPAAYPALLALPYLAPPDAVVCARSAAAVHGLVDDAPEIVQVAVAHPSLDLDTVPLEVFVFPGGTFEIGRSSVEVWPGRVVPVYDSARTVVDLFRLRSRFGLGAAVTARARYLQASGHPAELARVAAAVDDDAAEWLSR
jgi:predicted transcriptional regulator of viral defense system